MRRFFSRTDGQDSTNLKIFRAAMTVGLLGALARAGAAVKDLIVAQAFGRSDPLDAFLIALLLPAFVLTLMMSSLGSALIPVLVETRQKLGLDGTQKLLSSMMLLSMASLALIGVLLGLFAPYYLPLLGSSFAGDKLRLTRQILYCLLPFVLFSGFATFVSAALNAGKKLALPAVVPLVTPLITIALTLLRTKSSGVLSLAGGLVVG